MRLQFLKNTAETLKTYVYENNRKIVPSSATITVYKPGTATKIIDGAAMTVGSDGLLSYGLTADNNSHSPGAPPAYNSYKAVIAYVYSGTTYYTTLFYDVVISRLAKVITDDDIVNELPQLKDNGWRIRGTADSGSATTIVSVALKRYEDNYFTGGLAYSPTKDETREITGFVSSTGTVTTTAFSVAIAPAESYILMRSFSREIQRAFEKIEELLIRTGKRPYLVVDPYDLREVHLYYSVAEICKGLTVAGNEGFWWQMWKDYEAKAFAIFKSIDFKYDTFDDGIILPGETGVRNVLKVGRG